MTLIECVPNFSEGRRPEVVAAIVEAIQREPVFLLDVSSDADHNRSVVTFAGEPDAVGRAAFVAIRTAAAHIDLDTHTGEHPRIGAADVVPFIPLRGASLEDCAALAHEVGRRVGAELALPVYFYEAAALRPERANLAVVRRGGYEALKAEIANNPARQPDCGPSQVGRAGAVAIGARQPLIAFNAYLDTADVTVAQAVAAAIRTSGGGLPYLKALGLLVKGQAQVSMNVIDYRQSSLFTIMERVRVEAARHGALVTHTELVGLIPQAALVNTALDYLQLPPETRQQMLEHRLGAATGDYREVLFE
jgi:glutamate formiminotransferase